MKRSPPVVLAEDPPRPHEGRDAGPPLRDRRDAGERLARRLEHLAPQRPVVLGLPRGGVVVGYEIARHLAVPLDVLIVRKIGAPDNPEYGLGAVAEDGTQLLDEARVREAGYTMQDLAPVIDREIREIRRRAAAYRDGQPAPELTDRVVVLVDDGVATGVTLRCAILSARARRPARIVVALGVAPPDILSTLAALTEEVVVCATPEPFFAVGEWYREFDAVPDAEVRRLLSAARRPGPVPVR